jgi:6,7-dimethyl-8-ribityllumazine synthase
VDKPVCKPKLENITDFRRFAKRLFGLSTAIPVLYTWKGRCENAGSDDLRPKVHRGKLNAEGFRFAIVASRWNDFLTSKLVDGAVDGLESLGANEDSVEVFMVPGSFELPAAAKKVADSGRFDAIIALGVVIRGETAHFDYVAGEAAKVGQVSLETGVPVMFGVVTANTLEQAINRCGVKAGNKGFEAALSAVEVVNLYRAIGSGEEEQAQEKKAFPHVV